MFSRRDVLAKIAAAALVGPIGLDAAQHVHATVGDDVAADAGVYHPKALNQHEFDTLKRLCELTVPGASRGAAAEFIDLLSSQNAGLVGDLHGWPGMDRLCDEARVLREFLTRDRRSNRPRCSIRSRIAATRLRNWRQAFVSSIG